MKAPFVLVGAAVMAIACAHQARGASCTAPTNACAADQAAASLSRPARAWPPFEKRAQTGPSAQRQDPAKSAKRDAFLSLYERIGNCMREWVATSLRESASDETIKVRIERVCSPELQYWLQHEEGSTEREAYAFLDQMATKAIDAGRSAAPKPLASAQPAPATERRQDAQPSAEPHAREKLGYDMFLSQEASHCMSAETAPVRWRERWRRRDERSIVTGIAEACGRKLHDWRTRELAYSEEESRAILNRMARSAVDNRKAWERETLLQIQAQTVACMREGAVSQLRNGERDHQSVRDWVVGVCGRPLDAFIREEWDATASESEATLRVLADKAIAMALRGPDAIIVR